MMRARDPRQLDKDYKGWVARLPCAACMVRGKYNLGVHVAHLRVSSLEHGKRETGGAEKPHDIWVTPLCPPHHTGDVTKVDFSQHTMGDERAFWDRLAIDPFQLCIDLRAAYERGAAGAPIISRFAAKARQQLEGKT